MGRNSQSADAQEVAVAEVMKKMVWRVGQSQGIVQAEGDCEAGRRPRVKMGRWAESSLLLLVNAVKKKC